MHDPQIHLARTSDAQAIANMSRDHIETGLGWNWRRDSIIAKIRDSDTNVITARIGHTFAGFAIMDYKGFEAHLILFAVAPQHRRHGVGTALIRWLITTAEVAGSQVIYVELRKNNAAARAFYRSMGFTTMEALPRYYRGTDAGVRMALDLRRGKPMTDQIDKP